MAGMQRQDDSTFDLNLAPMLDILVSVIPMLLMSMVFVQIAVIETPVPQVVADAIAKDDQKTERETSVAIYLSQTSGIKIKVTNQGKDDEVKLPMVEGKFDLKALHDEMIKIKQRFPDVFKLDLNPDGEVSYNDIVAVMDKIRERDVGDPQIFLSDDKGTKTELKLLFPNVVFANVVEG